MAYLYHSTLKKATAVVAACKSQFTSPTELCLIVAKQSAIEVYSIPTLADTELTLIEELPIYGVILNILPIRLPKDDIDCLAVLLGQGKLNIYKYTRNTMKNYPSFKLVASGSLEERPVRHNEHGCHMKFDCSTNLLTISLFDGILKMSDLSDMYRTKRDDIYQLNFETIKIDDMPLFSMTYIDSPKHLPCLAVLSLDKGRQMSFSRLRIYEVELPLGDHLSLRKAADVNAERELESVCELIIPVPQPLGGFLLAGREAITYRNSNIVANAGLNFEKVSVMLSWGSVDPYRYLISDISGNLIMVQLITNTLPGKDLHSTDSKEVVTGLNVERLGVASQASCIVYLDCGMVFIGSVFGDSQIIQLTTTKQKGNHFKERIWLENHGPIIDMEVLNREVFSQATMITLSGAFQDGSIRVIQNGVGVQERLEVQGDQWKSIWSVRLEQEEFDDVIVINEVGGTLLGFLSAADEMQPLTLDGIQHNLETRYSAIVAPGVLLQAATNGLYFIGSQRLAQGKLLTSWKPTSSGEISHCTSYANQIVVASVSTLYYIKVHLEVASRSSSALPSVRVEVISELKLDNDIACVDMTPFDTSIAATPQPGSEVPMESTAKGPTESKLVVVCLWNSNDTLLLALPSLELIHRQSLGAQWLARSVTIAELVPGLVFLLIALCNGQLLYCNLDIHTGELGELRSITVGDGPMKLTQWIGSNGRNNVFVSSKYPCIVYAHNNRFTLTPVNTKSTDHMCAYHGEKYHRHNLVLLRGDNLYFVKVDDIKKMHTRKINLHESGRRLAVSERENLLITASVRYEHLAMAPYLAMNSGGSGSDLASRGGAMNTALNRQGVRNNAPGVSGGGGSTESGVSLQPQLQQQRMSINEEDVKYQPSSEESISLKGNAAVRTFGPKCSVDASSKRQCLHERQVSSLLVYNLRNLSLTQVHTFSHSSRYYESVFSIMLCSPHELDGMGEYLQQHQVANENHLPGSSALIAAEIQAALKRKNAHLSLSYSGRAAPPGSDLEPNKMESSSITESDFTSTELPLTLLIVGTSIQGTEPQPPGDPWFGRIHVLLWCGSQQTPHFETIMVKDITGVPYCMALQHGCLLIGVNSSLRCYHFEEEQLKEVCDMYQDITLISGIEVKDNYILVADLIRSLIVLTRKKGDKKFTKISAYKRARWTSTMKLLDPCNFLMNDSDLNLLVLSRQPTRADSNTPFKKMRIDPSPGSGTAAGQEAAGNAAATGTVEGGGGGGGSSLSARASDNMPAPAMPLLKESALFHLGESVNVYKRGSMRTATMDEIKYFSDSLLYGSVSGHIGYVLRIPDTQVDMFEFLVKLEECILKLPSTLLANSGYNNLKAYRDWRQYRQRNLTLPQANVVDGDIVERFLELSQDAKLQVAQNLQIPKFLLQGVDGVLSEEMRSISVDELSSFVEQLSRSH